MVVGLLTLLVMLGVGIPTGSIHALGGASPVEAQAAGDEPTTITDTSDAPIADGVRDSIVRLYYAVFDRTPDDGGRDYWVGQYVAGVSLERIATEFMVSTEWTSTYGTVDDPAFVELLYGNVLGRTPDGPGAEYWMGELARGVERSTILTGFSESAEFVNVTGTAPPEAPPPPPPPPFPAVPANSGEGRRIVYSNSGHRVWLVEADESIVDSYLVSGRRATPGAGVYQVYSKSPKAWAGHDGITMDHMVRFAHGRTLAIGFHSIPRWSNGAPMQTEAQLGSYRSSGCVRQRDDKAAALYAWAPIGTTVVVLA